MTIGWNGRLYGKQKRKKVSTVNHNITIKWLQPNHFFQKRLNDIELPFHKT